MKSFLINENDAGQRVDRFLQKAVPDLPQTLLYKYLRIKRIKRNKKRCTGAERLEQGDLLELYINDEFFGKPHGERLFEQTTDDAVIVYEDANLLLADKPAGLLCHSDDSESVHTLINKLQLHLYRAGEYDPDRENSFAPALCNRIDRNTSGLVIAAKNAAALREMTERIRRREVQKTYHCAVFGQMPAESGELTGYLKKNAADNTVTVYPRPTPGALTAVSRYRVLRVGPVLSLLEVELVTGRTHQIRAQFAATGHPLLGDTKYGTAAQNKAFHTDWQALRAMQIRFAFSDEQGCLAYLNRRSFTVPPADFEKLV